MRKPLAVTGLLTVILLLGIVTARGLAQENQTIKATSTAMVTALPVTDDEVNEIASQLYCPICQNVPLDVCPSQACADWRELVREYLKEGKSAEEIKAYFSAQYGWNVLAVPPARGWNWLIYVLPPLVVIGGLIFVILMVRKSKTSLIQDNSQKASPNKSEAKDYLVVINRDLKDEG